MKEFNLEQAKMGKPVCTRNGRKVRIIYYEKKGLRPIVALIEDKNDEYVHAYSDSGDYDSPAIIRLLTL